MFRLLLNFSCRPETPEDEPLVRRLIVENVGAELMADHWPEPIRETLLGMQYSARRDSIRNNYAEAQSWIVMLDDQTVGWYAVASLPHEIRLIDIIIGPEQRGKGIASAVIRELLASAHRSSRPVRLNVNATNTGAIRLYSRLGFEEVGGNQFQRFMEKRAAGTCERAKEMTQPLPT